MSEVGQVYRNMREELDDNIRSYSKIFISSETNKFLKEKDGEEHVYGFGPLQVEIDDSLSKSEVRVE